MPVTNCASRAAFALAVFALCVWPSSLSAAFPHEAHLSVPRLCQASPARDAPRKMFKQYPAPNAVTSSVTGTYNGPHSGSLDVLDLPGRRIQFDLMVLQDAPPSQGVNIGEAAGVVALHNGVAVYHVPIDPDNPSRGGGRLTMRFYRSRVHISEEGDLDFGLDVTASGTYTRHSRKPPKFSKEGHSV